MKRVVCFDCECEYDRKAKRKEGKETSASLECESQQNPDMIEMQAGELDKGAKVTRKYNQETPVVSTRNSKTCFKNLHGVSEKVIRSSPYAEILRSFELLPGWEPQTSTFLRDLDFALHTPAQVHQVGKSNYYRYYHYLSTTRPLLLLLVHYYYYYYYYLSTTTTTTATTSIVLVHSLLPPLHFYHCTARRLQEQPLLLPLSPANATRRIAINLKGNPETANHQQQQQAVAVLYRDRA